MAQAVETETPSKPSSPSRRAMLEKLGLYAGAILAGGSIGSEAVSRGGISIRVNREIPKILESSSLATRTTDLEILRTRTPVQDEILTRGRDIFYFHQRNEVRRAQRANELQDEADATPVLGIATSTWRDGIFKAGVFTFTAAILSKSRLLEELVNRTRALIGK